MFLLQSMPEFVVPLAVTASFGTVGAVAVWGVRTIRKIESEIVPRVEQKLDRVLAVMYGPPESKEADGIVKDVRDLKSTTEQHWEIIRAQVKSIDEIDRRASNAERLCAITHRKNINGEAV